MKQTIEAKEKELGKIFSDDYTFEIPPYQRPYAWTVDQASELLDDLMTSMGTDEELDNVPPYFLGSIVLIKDPSSTQKPSQVVDGQQRLTTLTILLCILRELAADADKDMQQEMHEYVCQVGKKAAGTTDRFRLSLRDRDRKFFIDNVQNQGKLVDFLGCDKEGLSDSKKRMHENASYIYQKLQGENPEWRNRLAGFLIRRCYLVVVSAYDLDSAYRIFSVMNDRGLNLSPTDILKAEIIGAIPDEESRANYTDQWDEIEEELGRENFRNLFTHIRMIHAKKKAEVVLHQEFRREVLKKYEKSQDFIDKILEPLSEAYQIISKVAYRSESDAEKVNAYLRHLGRLDNSDWMPPAIEFFKRNKDNQKALIGFTRNLERLAYALFILRANVGKRIKRYADVLQAIERGEDFVAEEGALQLWPEEIEEVIGKLDGPVYKQGKVRRALLLRLDSLLADKGATYDYKVISIEHVLPQNPKEGSVWYEWFPDSEERENWTHRIANLALLSHQKNTQAQNYDFEKKKEKYFQEKSVAPFALTAQVLKEDEWSPAILEKRQENLIGLLKEEWRLG